MKRKLSLFIFSLCFLNMAATGSFATCDCFEVLTNKQEFGKSKAVFLGQLVKTELREREDRPDELASEVADYLTFKIEKSWKGENISQFSGWVHATHYFCHTWKFEEGKKYLIYARKYKGNYIVGEGCTRTRPFEGSSEEQLKEFKQLNNFWFRFRAFAPFF